MAMFSNREFAFLKLRLMYTFYFAYSSEVFLIAIVLDKMPQAVRLPVSLTRRERLLLISLSTVVRMQWLRSTPGFCREMKLKSSISFLRDIVFPPAQVVLTATVFDQMSFSSDAGYLVRRRREKEDC